MNFPDPNVTTEYETPDGLKYVWNGFAWELVCGGVPIPDVSGFVTQKEFATDQARQDDELESDQKRQDDAFIVDQQRQDDEFVADQQRQDDEFKADQDRQDAEIEAIKDDIDFCKVDQGFVCFPVGIMHSDMDVQFTGNGVYFTTAFLFEVGDELTVETNDGSVDTYLIDNVGEIEQEPANGNEMVKPKRYYSFTTACAHNYVMKGSVYITSCEYPYVTPEEFAEDQKRQDDAFAEDQQRQDDALQAEINIREERDLLHDAEIDTLEYKLDALIGVQFKGTYEFLHSPDCEADYLACMAAAGGDQTAATQCTRDLVECEKDTVRPGFFEALDPDDQFDHLEEIIISKSDTADTEIDWSGVLDAGDYLEVDHSLKGDLDKRNYGLYRIEGEPEHTINQFGEDVYSMKLLFLQGEGVLAEGEQYEIRGITAAEGVNPEELGDFLTKDDANSLYALKTHKHSGADITSGTISIDRLPTGTNSTTVSKGNHGHSGYAASNHTHSYVSKGSTDKFMTHKGGAGCCEFYKSGSSLYWR